MHRTCIMLVTGLLTMEVCIRVSLKSGKPPKYWNAMFHAHSRLLLLSSAAGLLSLAAFTARRELCRIVAGLAGLMWHLPLL